MCEFSTYITYHVFKFFQIVSDNLELCTMSSKSKDCTGRHFRCCDPFKCHKQWVRKGLRVISETMISLHHSLNLQSGDKLCTQCRKKLSCMPQDVTEVS